VSVAAALLAAVLAAFLGALGSGMRASKYGADRERAIDDLRTAVAAFSKDARQGVAVTTAAADRVTLRTYVGGAPATVTWQTVADGTGQFNLARREGTSAPRLFVVNLTSGAVFGYFGEVDPARIHRIRITLATRPDPEAPEVLLATDLEMRNAT
jgi:hypothetical protein